MFNHAMSIFKSSCVSLKGNNSSIERGRKRGLSRKRRKDLSYIGGELREVEN